MYLMPDIDAGLWDRVRKAASTGREAAPARAPVRKKVACLDSDGTTFLLLVCSSPVAIMAV
jgi:hypothetical protein